MMSRYVQRDMLENLSSDASLAPPSLRVGILAMYGRLVIMGKYAELGKGQLKSKTWGVSIAGARCALMIEDWIGDLYKMNAKNPAETIDWSGDQV